MKVQVAYVREHGDIWEYLRILGIKGVCGSIGYMLLQRGKESAGDIWKYKGGMRVKKNTWESKGTKRAQGVMCEITRGDESTGGYMGVRGVVRVQRDTLEYRLGDKETLGCMGVQGDVRAQRYSHRSRGT